MLMLAAQGKAPLTFAHIGMLKALHAGKPEAAPEPRRKRAFQSAKCHRVAEQSMQRDIQDHRPLKCTER